MVAWTPEKPTSEWLVARSDYGIVREKVYTNRMWHLIFGAPVLTGVKSI